MKRQKPLQRKIKTKRLPSISRLKKEADRVFSLWIRNRDKACVTCGSTNNLQNGHYVSRSFNSLRYDELNCNAQCMRCNVFLNGNMDEYTLYVISHYGYDTLLYLSAKKRQLKQFTRQELEDIIKKYSLPKNKDVIEYNR